MTIQEIYMELNADYDDVLSRFKNDERIEKYLRKLVQMNDFEELEQSIEEKNYTDAFRYVHNIKGMSINMGIPSLVNASEELCEILRGDEPKVDIEPYFEKVSQEYKRITDIVENLRNKVLIIDDSEFNREILEEILEDEYSVLLAEDGSQALDILQKYNKEIRVVLLDLIMPNMDGYEVLDKMEQNKYMEDMPVLVISSEQAVEVKKRCFSHGVSDFIIKPFDNIIVKKRVKDTVDLFTYRKMFDKKTQIQEKETEKNVRKLVKRNEKLSDILCAIIDGRNIESEEHIENVKKYTGIIAREVMNNYPEYGLTKSSIQVMEEASAMHDIGKISISDAILSKPDRLTKEEFEEIKLHTIRGCEIIEQIGAVWDEEFRTAAYEICKYHHERYDGKGYPIGLSGEDIPISAQIVGVSEVYDALVHSQSYRAAISGEQAFNMIVNGECGTFSSKIIECFKSVKKEIEE